MENVTEDQKMTSLFLNLVQQFYQSALIFMGKIENPQTKKKEINKDMARYFIDTLEMLMVKTKNNLSDQEEKMLTKLVQELKLDFIKENK
ncbi:MAG: DUF1844 domain-containing protein [Calditrichia bacterium]|nr:DUF1844 domain-containing protein [Calditrichia bacterium]